MTFADLSEATATLERVDHRSQNTFNRIQNSLMTIEIHDQGEIVLREVHKSYSSYPFNVIIPMKLLKILTKYSAETSFCWAFSISTMLRHSLNYFLRQLARERPMRYDNEKIGKALQYLNGDDFHKRLRNRFQDLRFLFFNEFTQTTL